MKTTVLLLTILIGLNSASFADDVDDIFRQFKDIMGGETSPPAEVISAGDDAESDENSGSAGNDQAISDDEAHGIAGVNKPSSITPRRTMLPPRPPRPSGTANSSTADNESSDQTGTTVSGTFAAPELEDNGAETSSVKSTATRISDISSEFSFRDADLRETLEIIAKMTNMNIFLDDAVPKRNVTTFLQDITLEEAMPHLLATNGLMMKEVGENTILIFPKNKDRDYIDDGIYKTFFLSSIKTDEMIQLVKSLDRDAWVSVNKELNSIIVKAPPKKMAMLEDIIKEVDRRKPQLLLDMRLVETSVNRLNELGISFDAPLSSITFPNYPETSDKIFRVTSPNALLRALEDDDNSRMLARPKLRLVDGKDAKIRIADRIPLKITTHTTDSANTTFTDKIEWQDAGIKFGAELLSIHRHNIATVKVMVEVSSVIGTTSDGYPEIRTREAESTLRVKDGETVVVGGLLNTKNITKRVRTPFLSRLPLIGNAFVYNKKEKVDSEIIIFLSPFFVDEKEADDEIIWARQ